MWLQKEKLELPLSPYCSVCERFILMFQRYLDFDALRKAPAVLDEHGVRFFSWQTQLTNKFVIPIRYLQFQKFDR